MLFYIMQFAADEINNNETLCPGVKLVLHYAEIKNTQSNAVLATFSEILNVNVRGIAGGFFSAETANIQLAAKIYSIPQVSGKATTEDLSDKTNYPYFARATLGDALQSTAVLQLFSRYNWKKAILIYTNEVYGISGNMVMLGVAGLQIFSVQIANNATGVFTDALAQISRFVEEQECRVFLFYALTNPGMAFLAQMKNTWSSQDYVYVFTTPITTGFVESLSLYTNLTANFDGAILISAALGSGPVYDEQKPKWDALDPKAYPGKRPDPQSFWYWYDTVYIFAHALDSMMRKRGAISDSGEANQTILDEITGPEYFGEIMKVDFYGATGRVKLDSKGDRIGDAGVWNLRNGSVVSIGRFYGANTSLILQEEPTFFGGRTDAPPDSPSHILPIRVESRSIKIVFGVLIAICIIVTLIIAAFLIAKPIAFRKSGKFYCGVIVFGALLAYAAAITTLPTPTDHLCLAFPWLLGLGFMLVFGCLFLKTWALFQVFRAAEQMKKTTLNPYFIMKILGLFLLIEAILMIVWSVVDPPKANIITVTGNKHRQLHCSAGNTVFWAVFIGYKGVWMFFGAIISFLVRNVRDDYNESAGIGMAVYNCFGVTIIAVVLGFVLKKAPDDIVIIENIAIIVAFTTTLILLFVRPVMNIINKKTYTANPATTSTQSRRSTHTQGSVTPDGTNSNSKEGKSNSGSGHSNSGQSVQIQYSSKSREVELV
eukprot:Phypoly_transcript_00819.p1 GENE.Phypoly_transcript_00819~~Phypoly_transcript_00819.p1  ORF type:complete len:714 (+),score=78.96 Phypoly_transcript_00819:1792-3933(+)